MEYEFTANGVTAESSEMLLTLFKKRKEFLCLLSSSTTEKGRKASLNVRPCVNMEFMSSLFLTVFSKDISKEEPAAPTCELRKEMEFVQFIVSSGCDGLKSVSIARCFMQPSNELTNFNYRLLMMNSATKMIDILKPM